MIGTLKLSTNFARFGFVVPRTARRNAHGRQAQANRSSRSLRADGLIVAHDRTTAADTRIAAINLKVPE
jgi:hypothetical protein